MPGKVLDRTEGNMESLARRLKEVGIPGYQVVSSYGLAAAGADGDRETFYVTGTKIQMPSEFLVIEPHYNEDVQFGINLNGEGVDSEDWLDFQDIRGITIYQRQHLIIDHVLFFKLTIRNYLAAESGLIRIWIFQDPLWIDQVNAMLKDITP